MKMSLLIENERIVQIVRTLAPIALQARHFPPSLGEADIKEKENIVYVNRIFTLHG